MSTHFQDRHIVVTGGAGALGTAVVAAVLEAGGTCTVPDVGPEPRAGWPFAGDDRVMFRGGMDLAEEGMVERLYAELPAPLWASLHAAGGFAMMPAEQTTAADFLAMHRMNLVTCFLCCREAVRRFAAQRSDGRIVNVAAGPAIAPVGGMLAYAVSKSGVAALTRDLALEVKDRGIWVNAVVPSIMDTPANREAMPHANHEAWPKVADVARVMLGLASPENRVTTGGLVPVGGAVN